MTIKSVQKVIKVGSSLAVTIPARDAKYAGLDSGSEVEITIRPLHEEAVQHHAQITEEYEAFKAAYGQTLRNLSQR